MSSIGIPTACSRGKRWAYAGAIVGGLVSVAANVAHSFVPAQPSGMADDAWRRLPGASPQGGAVLLAAFWPVALLLAVEILARVSWPVKTRWTLARWGGVTPVGAVAAIVSYRHLSGLLHWYGEDSITVGIGPLAVDGLMVISTAALLALAGWATEPSIRSEPIEEPSIQPSTHPSESDGWVGSDAPADRMDGLEPIGSDGSDRVVALRSVGGRMDDRVDAPAGAVARPEDLERAREAIRSEALQKPLTADAVRDVLKIGLKHARAVRDHLNAEPEEEPRHA